CGITSATGLPLAPAPGPGARSITVTRCPRLRNACAAHAPAMPAPTMTMDLAPTSNPACRERPPAVSPLSGVRTALVELDIELRFLTRFAESKVLRGRASGTSPLKGVRQRGVSLCEQDGGIL